ncbi:hypothetical protein SARC_00158 [Sphaeroforma arctica JP610]|uniref:U-box domain-containing protein n=1 Tax=Sphaeroforma arctica JP610 TaxID=667725 RepID=A0A0L0GFU8_9EUKA|nr:hypothetical protein SARC_00158 [Sphaeroforma arctica JP610]KNC87724.1 hypothetical protein SARC_00158 [Sphaeroforma arctica JP610]|eukprot:XP_014161626.1 hypothetical protein SARC_00158 [Sphaeroforma arctica JP610]
MSATDKMEGITCPITHAIMADPVVDPEGNCYDRAAIEQWLESHGVSPITRTPMTIANLVPNRNIGINSKLYQDAIVEALNMRTHPVVWPQLYDVREFILHSTSFNEVSTENETDGMMMDVAVHINTPNPTAQQMAVMPVDVVCVVDVSGSMAATSEVLTERGPTETHGLTLLDLVKHAITTIIYSLSADSRLAIVSFSTNAHCVLPLTVMDTEGTELALTKVGHMNAAGGTNLWAGLDSSIHLVLTRADITRCASIMLLTEDFTLNHKYLSDPAIPLGCQINTFGFGYNVQSGLLRDLAEAGTGTYSFIPDSGMCGTVFINTLAKTMSTLAINCQLTVEVNRDIGT